MLTHKSNQEALTHPSILSTTSMGRTSRGTERARGRSEEEAERRALRSVLRSLWDECDIGMSQGAITVKRVLTDLLIPSLSCALRNRCAGLGHLTSEGVLCLT